MKTCHVNLDVCVRVMVILLHVVCIRHLACMQCTRGAGRVNIVLWALTELAAVVFVLIRLEWFYYVSCSKFICSSFFLPICWCGGTSIRLFEGLSAPLFSLGMFFFGWFIGYGLMAFIFTCQQMFV